MSSLGKIVAMPALLLSLAVLTGCTSPSTALNEAVKCLNDRGIRAEVVDGALVATHYADDDTTPKEFDDAKADCVPNELELRQ